MKIRFDEESDIIYIRLDDTKKIVDSEEVKNGVVVDFENQNRVVGIEILGVKKNIPLKQLKSIAFELT